MLGHDVDINSGQPAFEPLAAEPSQFEPHGAYHGFGKRGLDVVLSLLMLPVLIPVMGIIAYLIRRDGGAAIVAEARVGRKGAVFSCYTFRSSVPGAEWGGGQKLANDPRITKIGRILRKANLDELPQIFNVLRGDMSLVGPCPFLPEQRELYDRLGGRAYYRLRPGVTGLWQIFSRHDTSFAARVRFDEAYGANLSLAGDLGLILRTARAVLSRTRV